MHLFAEMLLHPIDIFPLGTLTAIRGRAHGLVTRLDHIFQRSDVLKWS